MWSLPWGLSFLHRWQLEADSICNTADGKDGHVHAQFYKAYNEKRLRLGMETTNVLRLESLGFLGHKVSLPLVLLFRCGVQGVAQTFGGGECRYPTLLHPRERQWERVHLKGRDQAFV